MNRDQRDKQLVFLKCDRCGADIFIRYASYRKFRNQPHYCRSCRGKNETERVNALPESERIAYRNKCREAIRKGWASQDTDMRDKVSKLRKQAWTKERHKRHSDMLSKRWATMSEEEKSTQIQLMNEAKSRYWSNQDNVTYHSNRAREKWYAQTPEEQQRILDAIAAGRDKYYANLTDEERAQISERQRQIATEMWAKLSPEERISRIQKLNESFSKYLEGISKNEIIPSTEKIFLDFCNKNSLPIIHHYYNESIHPAFVELFKPFNGSTHQPSPFHEWDFKINLMYKSILVDVDGSIHNDKNGRIISDSHGENYKFGEWQTFRDSQRPYQTDGLEAYVIEAYDDTLSDDTPVRNICTNEVVSYKSFCCTLLWEMLSFDERQLVF